MMNYQFFKKVLRQCDYVIRQPDEDNELFVAASDFQTRLSDWLAKNDGTMSRIETGSTKFLKSLDGYLSESFLDSTRLTVVREDHFLHRTDLVQPSLLQCLLGVEKIQHHVIRVIMDHLQRAAVENSEDDIQLVATIIEQLKFIPTIVNEEEVMDRLLSIASLASPPAKSSIIKGLPYILPDHLHPPVVDKLLSKDYIERTFGGSISVPLLEALSAMEISEELRSDIQRTVVSGVADAPIRDLGIYLTLLLRVDDVDCLDEVIERIRERVSLTPIPSIDTDTHQVELFNKLGFCISTNPEIPILWTKKVKEDLKLETDGSIRKIDLLMLLLFSESHKPSESLLMLLFERGKLIATLMSQLVAENKRMIYELFPILANLLDSILKSKQSKYWSSVQEVAIQLFPEVGPVNAELLIKTLTCIIVNFPHSRETAISILTNLAEKEPVKLLRFSRYMMELMDLMTQFPFRAAQGIMNILATLAQEVKLPNGQPNHLNVEFSMLLRKQLTHPNTKVRFFGIFGAMAAIRKMSDKDDVAKLLELSWKVAEKSGDDSGIFFDALSESVGGLHTELHLKFSQYMKSKFSSSWIRKPGFRRTGSLKLVPSFRVIDEGDEECVVVLEAVQTSSNWSGLAIPAQFRLISRMEISGNGSLLTSIMKWLSCPILFPKAKYFDGTLSLASMEASDRTRLGAQLVIAINYFREAVSALIGCSDRHQTMVLSRLEHIIQLQRWLVIHFEEFPALPYAYAVDGVVSEMVTKAKPKKNANELQVKKRPIDEIQPTKIECHIRKLDRTVFRLLSQPPSNGSGSKNPSLQIILLLLVEYKQQTENEMNPLSISYRNDLLPTLLQQLKYIAMGYERRDKDMSESCIQLIFSLVSSHLETSEEKYGLDSTMSKSMKYLAVDTTNYKQLEWEGSTPPLEAIMAYMIHFASFVKEPATAVVHLKLMKSICELLEAPMELKNRTIGNVADGYLKNEWELDTEQITSMLNNWLDNVPSPIEKLEELCRTLLNDTPPRSTVYASCTDSSYAAWYDGMFCSLLRLIKKIKTKDYTTDWILEWTSAVSSFNELVQSVNSIDKAPLQAKLLLTILHSCKPFIQRFIRDVLYHLPNHWKDYPDQATALILAIQQPCRTIQKICHYSKKEKDHTLIVHVPRVRMEIEKLTALVQKILIVHGGPTSTEEVANPVRISRNIRRYHTSEEMDADIESG